MEQESKSLESVVMGRIASGSVKLRSRYVFLAERVAFGSALLFGALAAALVFSLIFFYLRETETLAYFAFGSDGVSAFLESFPFGSVIAFVVLSFATALLLRRADISYRRPFIFVVGFLFLFIVGTGFALAQSRAIDAIEAASYRENFAGRMVRPFFRHTGGGGQLMRKFGVVGRVMSVDGSEILMQTPEGIRKLQFEHVAGRAKDLVPGAFIMGVGAREGESFRMKKYRIVPEGEARLLRRNVHRMK